MVNAGVVYCLSMSEWTIQEIDMPPNRVPGGRDLNQLTYGPNRLLAAEMAAGTVGAVRFAVRADRVHEGLITDLMVDEDFRRGKLPAALIAAAEERLKSDGVKKIDAVVVDGQQLSDPFQAAGYWPFRKTVVIGWRLSTIKPPPTVPGLTIELTDRINVPEVAGFIFGSYQPYWQWWKETAGDKPIGQVEYVRDEPAADRDRARHENWSRVVAVLENFGQAQPALMVIARQAGTIVGLCDAKADPDESMDWGVLISRKVGGRAIGSALLGPTLQWLREQGLKTAQVTTTSGLDDYDPTVYLYVLAGGGQIRGEFLVLRKGL